ncbi:helix-turn-helix domain-containing protein [Modestobacter sp. VKM Ac-2979]|uniref:helix-turn-helix domain-containing protein n=1 Tax=unclassified Modestobacter TaxID=2643866 RepID=UPI0022AB9ED3|nr:MULTISPECIES: helix-turn-helix domain-containing protein [unclassified Modestobacter]MCZ2811724.1 helix-turn-helix domain-containing protein [Modestobacter sp. VKM Ac-2979]MCZ2843447.1 helix-turn-helix domain-containing protein [Modestobacter sp. VKM Ac-2980]
MEQVRGPRGTVVQGYLGEAAGSVAPDAVLLHGPAQWAGLSARSWHLGRIPACDFRDRADVVVTPVPATRRLPGHCLGVLFEGEGTLQQCGPGGEDRTVLLAPDRVVLYSRNRPFRLQVRGPYRYLLLEVTPSVLGVGQEVLRTAAADDALAASPSARVLAGLLAQLPDQFAGLSAQQRLQAADAVTGLLAGHVRAAAGGGGHRDELFEAVLRWIDDRLGDPSLSPGTIAAAHHVSTRHLHKVFSRHALTVAGHVRGRRLDRVRRDLEDPVRRGEPVAAIARRWGIVDPSHLSKAFRSRHGVSPREHRERAAAGLLATSPG